MKIILYALGAILIVTGFINAFDGRFLGSVIPVLIGLLLIRSPKNAKRKENASTTITADKPRAVGRVAPEDVPDFVAFDFETTGLDADTCDIIQAGAVRYVGGKEVASFNKLANPGVHISAKITEITGLKDKDVKTAQPSEEVAKELIAFIDGMPLVAHNAPFDLKFLKKYAPSYQPRVYDTLRMSRDASPGGSHKLGDLMKKYGISGNWHDALSDCRAAAELFLILYTPDTEPYRKGRSRK